MADLVERLRTNAELWHERDDEPWRQDMRDAADEIERMRMAKGDTGMTDAPERIWAWHYDHQEPVWAEHHVDGSTEYIRADLHGWQPRHTQK